MVWVRKRTKINWWRYRHTHTLTHTHTQYLVCLIHQIDCLLTFEEFVGGNDSIQWFCYFSIVIIIWNSPVPHSFAIVFALFDCKWRHKRIDFDHYYDRFDIIALKFWRWRASAATVATTTTTKIIGSVGGTEKEKKQISIYVDLYVLQN